MKKRRGVDRPRASRRESISSDSKNRLWKEEKKKREPRLAERRRRKKRGGKGKNYLGK